MGTEPVKYKITVVDDERDLVATIKTFLESRNFTVSVAYDGLEGLETITAEKPDLVILDISMPKIDGRDVLTVLKANALTKNIPVIFLTARDEEFERAYGLEIGAAEYITKPYNSASLLRKITNLLAKN